MYSIICTKEYRKQIRNAVDDSTSIIAEKVGIFDDVEIENVIQEISRAFCNVLIVDITCHPEISLVSALRKFNIARPKTRIVIVAPGYSPGNRTISGLVKFGVWDIVATPPIQEEDMLPGDDEITCMHDITPLLIDILGRPKNEYADAARWDIFDDCATSDNPKKSSHESIRNYSNLKDRQIIEKLLGTITIAVAGTSHGVGTTHTAIAISQYLARRFDSVAIVELNSKKDLFNLKNDEYKKGKLDRSFVINGVDYYPYRSHDILEIIKAEYKYLVLDIGLAKNIQNYYKTDRDIKEGSLLTFDSLIQTDDITVVNSEYYSELVRSDCRILVTGLMEWQINNLIKMINKGEDLSKWHFYVTNATRQMVYDFQREIKTTTVYQAPFSPDPLEENKEQDAMIEKMIKDVLPSKSKPYGEGNRFMKFLRRST